MIKLFTKMIILYNFDKIANQWVCSYLVYLFDCAASVLYKVYRTSTFRVYQGFVWYIKYKKFRTFLFSDKCLSETLIVPNFLSPNFKTPEFLKP